MELYCEIKIIYIEFSDYFRHLWNYNENKNHVYCDFRIILDTFGIIMRNKNHILCFSDYFRHLWNYNENENLIYFVFRIFLNNYGNIMENKTNIFLIFGLFLTIIGN